MGTSVIQVLGTDSGDTSPSLCLTLDGKKFLFNVGEGLQRLCTEHRVRLKKVSGLFVSGVDVSSVGGLPGLMLTVADAGGKDTVTLGGPPAVANFLHATRLFTRDSKIPLTIQTFAENQQWKCAATGLELKAICASSPTETVSDITFEQQESVTMQRLLRKVRKQIEYYFSDASLKHDTFLNAQLVEHDGWLPISVLMGFPKLKTLSDEVEIVLSALRSSQILQLNKEQTLVRRPGYTPTQEQPPKPPSSEPPAKKQKRCATSSSSSSSSSRPYSIYTPVAPLKPADRRLCVSYVCRLPDKPGRFDPKAAVALGVPRGPAFSKLTMGESYTTESGSVVLPSQVMGKSIRGVAFAFVKCACLDVLGQIRNDEAFGPEANLVVMFHATPVDVFHSDHYQQWVKSFDAKIQHVILNRNCIDAPAMFRASTLQALKLNALRPELFKAPFQAAPTSMALETNQRHGHPLMAYQLAPAKKQGFLSGANTSNKGLQPVLPIDLSEEVTSYLADVPDLPNIVSETKNAFQQPQQQSESQSSSFCERFAEMPPAQCPDLTFLGTGCAIPSKYRNVSGILLEMPDKSGILMDCGEGTYGQLVRLHGFHGADEVLANLKAVWISHLHADHHLGLMAVLANRERISQQHLAKTGQALPKLVVVGPERLLRWLREYDTCSSDALSFAFVSCQTFQSFSPDADFALNLSSPTHPGLLSFSEDKKLHVPSLGLSLSCVRTIHTWDSFGLLVEDEASGWKVCYSGDTRPCPGLTKLGQNSTILIHEATLEHELQQMAEAKKHSTVEEAVSVARDMSVELSFLTHFSQRYAKLAEFDTETNPQHTNLCVMAFDLMSINFSQLQALRQPSTMRPVETLLRFENGQAKEDEGADVDVRMLH